MQQELIKSPAIGALSGKDAALILEGYMATKDFEQIQSSTPQEAPTAEIPAVAAPVQETAAEIPAVAAPVQETAAEIPAVDTPLKATDPAVVAPIQPNTSK